MAQAPTTTSAPSAAKKEDRINVVAFSFAGYIKVDTKKTATITKACDDVVAAVELLKKAGGVLTRDEEPQFKTVNAKTGADD